MEREVVGNRALEEFRERLLRWDELCVQLRELYYKYLDLAAFRSEKCYFPGRRCKRPWGREYDVGDLTLMWTYIANTAPLCGKLMRALAEVEYQMRKRALESLEKYGGVEKSSNPRKGAKIVHIRLKEPVYAYLVLMDDKLYVLWKEFEYTSKDGRKRSAEITRKILGIINRYKRGEVVDVEVSEFEVDREYERLWLEVPLPEDMSKLLGGRGKAPVALFRNLGWLLSDDSRVWLSHTSANSGQVALRLFDWIALARYATDVLEKAPSGLLMFKLAIYYVVKTEEGDNPKTEMWPINTATEVIRSVYGLFGITLSEPEEVLARGYAVLKALREASFKREGKTYVVDDVGAWIAFSNVVDMLIVGDGFVMPTELGIVAKTSPKATLTGETTRVKKLAEALGCRASKKDVRLHTWHMRLLLPTPHTPTLEKTVKLFETLANYPVAAIVEINGARYLLTYEGNSRFVIGKKKGSALYKVINQLGLRMRAKKGVFVLTYAQLKELAKFVPVRLLNEVDKDSTREVKPVASPDLEILRKVLEEVVKIARIAFGLYRGREYIMITPYDKSKLWEIVAMLKAAGIRVSVDRSKGRIRIYEQKSVESIRRIMSYLFPHIPHTFFPQTAMTLL